ncbi:MAG TPA: type II toxin-antitoxin system RelE/ParE family toxin [Kiritimatiellia bacterium]|nr:type II toxin-antitoxin system RelE/ParE family toxin [Kiritimatiellia bacterium]
MAGLIWTEPALNDLEAIAEYIALDKPAAAKGYVQRVFESVDRLIRFPRSGSIPKEIPHLPYRQLSIPPCRIFYRIDGADILIVHVMRSEQRFREENLTGRD